MSVLVPNNPRVRRAPRLAFLPSPRRSLRAVMALRGQITTPGPEQFRRAQFSSSRSRRKMKCHYTTGCTTATSASTASAAPCRL